MASKFDTNIVTCNDCNLTMKKVSYYHHLKQNKRLPKSGALGEIVISPFPKDSRERHLRSNKLF